MTEKREWLKMQRYLVVSILIFVTFIVCSCGQTEQGSKEMSKEPSKPLVVIPPPLKPGQVLDPNSDYAKYWTGYPSWVKLNDELVLKVPQQFFVFWINYYPEAKRLETLTQPKSLEYSEGFSFEMIMPDMDGYTPDNYLNGQFDEDLIRIVSIEPYPLSDTKNIPFPAKIIKPRLGVYEIDKYEDKYGLRCYEGSSNGKHQLPTDLQYCYGVRDEKLDENIGIKLSVPPYADGPVHPKMEATYITKKYGGLKIIWWAPVKHFSRWHDINQKIWQYINEWNVVKQTQITT